MNETRKQSVSLPVWALIAITAVLVAAVTSLIAVVVLGGDDQSSPPVTSTVPENSGEPTTTPPISSESTTTSPPTTEAAAADPTQQLEILTSSLGGDATYVIAEGDCPSTAAVVAGGQLRLYEWREVSWLETSFDLFANTDTPILSVQADDYAPNSGHESFLVNFDGPSIGGPIYGGVLGQYECKWSLIDILIDGSIGKVVIGLAYSADSGLSGYRTAGASSPDLFLSYDPHNVAYFAD